MTKLTTKEIEEIRKADHYETIARDISPLYINYSKDEQSTRKIHNKSKMK